MLISPGFFKGEGPEVKAVFTELRDLFLETNHKVLNGEIEKNYKGRIVEADALHAYINYTFGQCLSEDQAEFEMDRVSHAHTVVSDCSSSIISGHLLTTRVSLLCLPSLIVKEEDAYLSKHKKCLACISTWVSLMALT